MHLLIGSLMNTARYILNLICLILARELVDLSELLQLLYLKFSVRVLP